MKLLVARHQPAAAKLKSKLSRYRRPIVITTSVILLQLIFGWDMKFFIINIIWLFV